MNGFVVIDEQTWEEATPKERERMTFNTLKSIDTRLSKLEKRPIIDKFLSFSGGVFGGALAYLGIKLGG